MVLEKLFETCNFTTPNKLVFLFGGGIDSVAQVILLNKVLKEQSKLPSILLFHIDYGQNASEKELDVGMELIDKGYATGINQVIVSPICNENNPLFNSELYSHNKSETYDKSKCMVEARNAMLGITALFAIKNDSLLLKYKDSDIVFGFYAYTEPGTYPFPDETVWFIDKMNEIVNVYGYTNKFIAPFINMSKREILKSAYKFEPQLFNIAWTCYENGDKQCGRCPHCLFLKKFLKEELNFTDEQLKEMFIV